MTSLWEHWLRRLLLDPGFSTPAAHWNQVWSFGPGISARASSGPDAVQTRDEEGALGAALLSSRSWDHYTTSWRFADIALQ